jgi:hypothetical protein
MRRPRRRAIDARRRRSSRLDTIMSQSTRRSKHGSPGEFLNASRFHGQQLLLAARQGVWRQPDTETLSRMPGRRDARALRVGA